MLQAAKDPIFFESGQPNLFEYVGNNPASTLDRDGLASNRVLTVTTWMSWGLNRATLISPWLKFAGMGVSMINVVYAKSLMIDGKMSPEEFERLQLIESLNVIAGIVPVGDAIEKVVTVATGTYNVVTGARDVADAICPVGKPNN